MDFYTIGLILILVAMILICSSFLNNTIDYSQNLWWGLRMQTKISVNLSNNYIASVASTVSGGSGLIIGIVGLILLFINKKHPEKLKYTHIQ
jgi:uncharacterized membrane protein